MNNTTKKDLRCIWMVAGLVNYKLCDKNFDCENCEFHKIMQGILPEKATSREKSTIIKETFEDQLLPNDAIDLQNQINFYLYLIFKDRKIYLDRCYNPTHLWCKPGNKNTIEVGFDSFIFKILQPVDNLILPKLHKEYKEGQLMAWIIKKQQAIPLHSPIEGQVTSINPQIKARGFQNVILSDDYLFTVEHKKLQKKIRELCGEMHGLHWFAKSLQIIRNFLTQALHEKWDRQMGITLPDGGIIETNLQRVMSKELYQRMIFTLFFQHLEK